MGKALRPRTKQADHCRHCLRKITAKDKKESKARYYEEPIGYLAWHEWAELMSKTYVQRECPGCGRFTLWEPK